SSAGSCGGNIDPRWRSRPGRRRGDRYANAAGELRRPLLAGAVERPFAECSGRAEPAAHFAGRRGHSRRGAGVISWYAVYTQPHAEPKALDHLLRQGYSAYLPRYRAKVSHARRRQIVLRPLFPRYLFVAVDRATMPWRPILSTVGVTDIVRTG